MNKHLLLILALLLSLPCMAQRFYVGFNAGISEYPNATKGRFYGSLRASLNTRPILTTTGFDLTSMRNELPAYKASVFAWYVAASPKLKIGRSYLYAGPQLGITSVHIGSLGRNSSITFGLQAGSTIFISKTVKWNLEIAHRWIEDDKGALDYFPERYVPISTGLWFRL